MTLHKQLALDAKIEFGMLVELCVHNYATHDEVFDGIDEVFQCVTKL
jgi:hypothetical protein